MQDQFIGTCVIQCHHRLKWGVPMHNGVYNCDELALEPNQYHRLKWRVLMHKGVYNCDELALEPNQYMQRQWTVWCDNPGYAMFSRSLITAAIWRRRLLSNLTQSQHTLRNLLRRWLVRGITGGFWKDPHTFCIICIPSSPGHTLLLPNSSMYRQPSA